MERADERESERSSVCDRRNGDDGGDGGDGGGGCWRPRRLTATLAAAAAAAMAAAAAASVRQHLSSRSGDGQLLLFHSLHARSARARARYRPVATRSRSSHIAAVRFFFLVVVVLRALFRHERAPARTIIIAIATASRFGAIVCAYRRRRRHHRRRHRRASVDVGEAKPPRAACSMNASARIKKKHGSISL